VDVHPGQLWQLGEHRLICGDCTDPVQVARVMGGERAALCHADPPYGMGKEKDGIANDNLYREKSGRLPDAMVEGLPAVN
jgi:DNA modification methylase